jgi:uncharacterized RDD family membrane protein YckC
MPLPAGWYPVSGDPTGTQRYWDGEAFASGPKRDMNARRKLGFKRANSAEKWQMATPVARAVAGLIDVGAPFIVVVGIARSMGHELPELTISGVTSTPRVMMMIAAFVFVNEVLLIGIWGMSLGRLLLGLKVVDFRDHDRAPGVTRALVRLLVIVPGALFSAMMFALGKRRGLHDLAAGTAVIYA